MSTCDLLTFDGFSGAQRSDSPSVWDPFCAEAVFWAPSGYKEDESESHGQWNCFTLFSHILHQWSWTDLSSVCFPGQSEAHQPAALPDSSASGFPGGSAAQQSRPGAAAAGPGPLQPGPSPAHWRWAQRGQSLQTNMSCMTIALNSWTSTKHFSLSRPAMWED